MCARVCVRVCVRMCVCVRAYARARACVLCIWSGAPAGSMLPSSFAQNSLGKLFLVKLLRPGGKRPAVGRLPGEGDGPTASKLQNWVPAAQVGRAWCLDQQNPFPSALCLWGNFLNFSETFLSYLGDETHDKRPLP